MSVVVPKGEVLPQGHAEDPLAHYTRLFCRFLQLVFGSFEKGSYHWDEDEKLSEIIISDQSSLLRETAEKRPSIVLARGPVQYTNVAMDQFWKSDLESGRRTHTDLVSSVMTYNCLSREGLEAGKLAHISAMATRRFKRVLMKAGIHRVGEDITIGAESPPGSVTQPDSSEILMVSVSVPFFYQDYWTIEPLDKKLLTGLNINLSSRGEGSTSGGEINPPSIYGQVLLTSETKPLK